MADGRLPGPLGLGDDILVHDVRIVSTGSAASPGPVGVSGTNSHGGPVLKPDYISRSAGGVFESEQVFSKSNLPTVQMLRLEYHSLARAIGPYRELKKRTGAFNREARRLFEADATSLEYTSLRLDAEHFIDARFYETYTHEFAALGIQSAAEMPAFVVHYEYHIRSAESLSSQANSETLKGQSLTLEKLRAIPHEDARSRFPTLTSLLEAFDAFWRQKETVTVKGRTIELRSNYYGRIATELTRLIHKAKDKRL